MIVRSGRGIRHRLLAICFALPAAAVLCMAVSLARTVRQIDLNRDLIAAIERNDTKLALRLLAEGADARVRKNLSPRRTPLQTVLDLMHGTKPRAPEEGASALALAVQQNKTEMAAGLLLCGANQVDDAVKADDAYSNVARRPLFLAAMAQKNLLLTKLLLDHGADVRAEDDDQRNCLVYLEELIPEHFRYDGALLHFHRDSEIAFEMALILAAHGINLHQPIYDDKYLLGCAMDDRQSRLFEYLVSQRVSPREAQSALNGAVSTGSIALVKKLMGLGAHVPPLDPNADTPMLSAGDPAMVDFLVSRGIDVNTPMKRSREAGRTCLQQASARGNLSLVRCLVSHGADVNVFTDVNESPLMTAASDGNIRVVDYLLSHGARVNAAAQDGRTALYFAAGNSHSTVVIDLLRHGAEPNITEGTGGASPLMQASKESDLHCVRALLVYGAKVNVRDSEGKTAVDYARENGHFATESLLKQHRGRSGFQNHRGATWRRRIGNWRREPHE